MPTDSPELTSPDPNCFDGDAEHGIFVSEIGSDANPGTMTAPKRTLSAGVSTAIAQGKTAVYVTRGTFLEALVVANGVSVYGGYDHSWQRSPDNITTVTGAMLPDGDTEAAEASGVTAPTKVQLLTLVSGAPLVSGASSYGLRGSDDPGLVLDHDTCGPPTGRPARSVPVAPRVRAGARAAPTMSTPGLSQRPREEAARQGTPEGPGGPAVMAATATVAAWTARTGSPSTPTRGVSPAAPAARPAADPARRTSSAAGARTATPASFSGMGLAAARPTPALRASGAAPRARVGSPERTATAAAAEEEGGGTGCDLIGSNCDIGGVGGGGGGGGQGGDPGIGGAGGGGSFGIFLSDSTGATVKDSHITASDGGAGGAGGPSIAMFGLTAPAVTGTTLAHGSGGAGGAGGGFGGGRGADGAASDLAG